MKKKLLTIALAALCSFFTLKAQHITPLNIGDTVPDALWNQPLSVVNHAEGKSTLTLNDYRGKLIILDFWATWCGSCIAAMPKAHKLQEDFGDSLAVLPVAYEPLSKAANFLTTNQYLISLRLFSIAGDSVLQKAFPHKILPHYVWITPDGTFAATTSSEYLNAQYVKSILAGSTTDFVQKTDYDKDKLLFLSTPPQNTSLLNYSIFLEGKIDGLPSGSRPREHESRLAGYAIYNKPLYTLYQIILSQLLMEGFSSKRMIVKGGREQIAKLKDKSKMFTCDYINTSVSPDSVFQNVLSFVSASAPFSCYMEKRNVECLVLTSLGAHNKPGTKGGQEQNTLFTGGGVLKNSPVSILVKRLDQQDVSGKLLVLDETGYKHNIDVSLSVPFKSLEHIRKDLNRYGLDLKREVRDIEFYVFDERSSVPL